MRRVPGGRTGGLAGALHGADAFLGLSAGVMSEVPATGRSDFPSQINNVVAFPGVIRGAQDVGARRITERMNVVAAEAILSVVGDDLAPKHIVPSLLDPRVGPAVAAAVAAASD